MKKPKKKKGIYSLPYNFTSVKSETILDMIDTRNLLSLSFSLSSSLFPLSLSLSILFLSLSLNLIFSSSLFPFSILFLSLSQPYFFFLSLPSLSQPYLFLSFVCLSLSLTQTHSLRLTFYPLNKSTFWFQSLISFYTKLLV